MATMSVRVHNNISILDKVEQRARSLAAYLVLPGRAFFAMIFILSAFNHFSYPMIAYAAGQGVPLSSFFVPLSGLLAFFGGLSVLLGYHARIGALLLIIFLVPVTLMMHDFWSVGDLGAAQVQQIMFMKNLAMLGGALMIFYFGSGPFSLDKPRGR